MTPGKILIIALIALVIFFVAIAAADDCGCDGGGSGSGGDSGGSGDSGSGGSDSSSSDSGSSSSSGSGEEATMWRMKGDDLFEKGLYNESLSAYEKSTSLDPYAYKAWTGKGRVLLALGDQNKSVEAFQKAIRLDPGNTESYVLLGDALTAQGSYEEAVTQYTKALALNPNLDGVKGKITLAEAGGALGNVTEQVIPGTTAVIPQTEPPATGTPDLTQATTPLATEPVVTPKASFPGPGGILIAFVISSLLVVLRRR